MQWLYIFIPVILVISLCLWPASENRRSRRSVHGSVLLISLSDISVSPRLQYHIESFVKAGYHVDVIAYRPRNSNSLSAIFDDKVLNNISFYDISVSAKIRFLPLKAIAQFLILLIAGLYYSSSIHAKFVFYILPPSIPGLAASNLIALFNGLTLIVDWHNLEHRVFAQRFGGSEKLIPRISRKYELFMAKFAHYNLCVSKAFASYLQPFCREGSVQVLYDRPNMRRFQNLVSESERLSILKRALPRDVAECLKKPFKILVSSTSWSLDEDIGMLLDALSRCTNLQQTLIVIITGKGELKASFQPRIAHINATSKYVKIVTPWLSHKDYPKVVSCADFGVSLHTSSSGIDLPMKVLDMFGCGLPVLSVKFDAIHELVQDGENGLIFESSDDLLTDIYLLIDDQVLYSKLKRQVLSEQSMDWDSNWTEALTPILKNSDSLN